MMENSQNLTPNGREKAKICKVCRKEGYNIGIRDHIEANHLQGVSLPCNICEKTFRSRKLLRTHKCIWDFPFHKKWHFETSQIFWIILFLLRTRAPVKFHMAAKHRNWIFEILKHILTIKLTVFLSQKSCFHCFLSLDGLPVLKMKIWDHFNRPNTPPISDKNHLKNHFRPLESSFPVFSHFMEMRKSQFSKTVLTSQTKTKIIQLSYMIPYICLWFSKIELLFVANVLLMRAWLMSRGRTRTTDFKSWMFCAFHIAVEGGMDKAIIL